jgi:hypothetical protein
LKPELVEPDWEVMQDQVRYMAWIRRLSFVRLKKHHRRIFPKGGKFYMRMPGWCPRYYYERRLFYYYTATHYHLPNPWRKAFRKEALAILHHCPTDATRAKDMQILRDLQDFRNFTAQGIAHLSEDRIDTYLTRLGYMVELPEDQKRQILFELYHLHRSDIVPRHSLTTGKPIRYEVRKGLRAKVLENPGMGWPEFQAEFGPEFPRLRRSTFYHARKALKDAGYKLPKLKAGRRPKAIIAKGKVTDLGKTIQTIARSDRHKRKDTV